MNLYPIGENDVFVFVSVYNGAPFIKIRKVVNGQVVTRDGVSFSSYKLAQYHKIDQELQLAISEMDSVIKDFFIGDYKLIRYRAESKCLELAKIRATKDHQVFGSSDIYLDGEETTALFSALEKVEEEFQEIYAGIHKGQATHTAAHATSSSKKRKAPPASASSPAAPASNKFVKLEPKVPEYIDLTQ